MKRFLSFGFILAGTLVIFGVLGWGYYNQAVSNPVAVSLPGQIAGLPLAAETTGTQAAAEFLRLHGRQFPLTSGAIGTYGDHQATLWVAGTPLRWIAAGMVSAMHEKIAGGKSPFTPIGEYQDGSRTVYMLEGMGQKHFYFKSDNPVIWLAADPAIAESALQQILEYYP